MKPVARRKCSVCCLHAGHHNRDRDGRIVWCHASDQATWPLAPLKAKAGGRKALCARLGIDARTLPAEISDVQADRWAIRCGWHPEQVWPGWCDAGLRYVDRVFIEDGGWRQTWLHLEPNTVEQAA